MRALHTRFPWIVSFGCAALFLVVALIGTPIGNQIEHAAGLPTNSGILIQELLLVGVTALALTAFGAWRDAGFARSVQWQTVLLCLPPLLAPLVLLFRTGIAPTNPVQLLMLLVFTAMIGFAEEGLCRGVMLRGFLPQGAMKAAVYSSLIFGSMHLIHIFYGMNIGMAVLYAIYAAMIGFGFAAPYIRGGGALWPLIIVHALYDLLGKLGHGWGVQAQPTSSFEAVFRLVVAVLVALYGLWLLRNDRAVRQAVRVAPAGD